jgi:hypothetical protein
MYIFFLFHGDPQYTVKNLQFILTVEPENEKTKQKLEWAQKQREANQPTVPSTIGDEFEINTFMRVDLPEIQVHSTHPHQLVNTNQHDTSYCNP